MYHNSYSRRNLTPAEEKQPGVRRNDPVSFQTQALYDAAVRSEASSDWLQAAETWKACVNETLRQTEECRVQCEVASQILPEDRAAGSVLEKAAGKKQTALLFSPPVLLSMQNSLNLRCSLRPPALSLSLLACRQYCVTQVATRPGRISAHEDFLPSQLEHLHIAQFKGQWCKRVNVALNVTPQRAIARFYIGFSFPRSRRHQWSGADSPRSASVLPL